jgi:hypothetical protein
MRVDSFVFLSYCLSEKNDNELKKISQLLCSCEDKLLYYFENNFSNTEIGKLNKLRQQRDNRYN